MKKNESIVGAIVVLFLLFFVLPLRNINWGKVNIGQDNGITVVGQASSKVKNQIASFTAGININRENKDEAVKEVNDRMAKLIEEVKAFGIKGEDIKTQGVSINESERYDTKKKEWYVGNTIEIVLREVDKAGELTDLLSKSGANNVYGPNLMLDQSNEAEKALYDEAMKDAREKAEIIAKTAGRKLGKVISVLDGGSITDSIRPWLSSAKEGMGGANIETGSSTVSKSMTVVFEMR
jgi:uncharacterized protein